MSGPPPLLSVHGLRKAFGSVVALEDVSLEVADGAVTALVGDNGAGKSTLVKCIVGVHRPDAGTIRFDGAPVSLQGPEDARALGIATVFQDLALIEQLTVWQNLFLDREITRRYGPLRILDRQAMIRGAERSLDELGIGVPSVRTRVGRLSGGQRQGVAIGRATAFGARLVVMDEPTAALGVRETAHVEELIVGLKRRGVAVLVISHNLEQVMRIADHVWVMRRGRVVGRRRTAETDRQELVAMITGVGGDEDGAEGEGRAG